MEGHKNKKMTMLLAEKNRLNEENRRLNSTLKRMISKRNDLRMHIRFLVQQRRGVDGSQVFMTPDHRGKDLLCARYLSDADSDKPDQDWNYPVGEIEKKDAKFNGGQQLHSKKMKIENGITSSMDGSPCCDEKSPKKKHQALRRGSGEQTVCAPKKIVTVHTRSEASLNTDGCRWRKYGQKVTRNNTHPRSYYKCAMVPGCPVKKQVQRCAEDPTIVITTYEDEHSHSLSPLAIAVLHASTNQHSAWSPFPTVTLDLTGNRPNPAFHMQPAHLAVGSFQQLTPSSNYMGELLDNQSQIEQPSVMDSVASIKKDPNFTAALAVAIAGSMLKLGTPIEGIPKLPPETQCTDVPQRALALV